VDGLFHALGLGTAQWEGRGGFETLAEMHSADFWFFACSPRHRCSSCGFGTPTVHAVRRRALSVGAGDFLRHLRLHGLQRVMYAEKFGFVVAACYCWACRSI